MWDELQVLIPPAQDPYPIIDGIQKLVEKETEANAASAEAEWQQASARYRVQDDICSARHQRASHRGRY